MTISFEVPEELQQELQTVFGDLGQAAKEALALQGYSERKFGSSTVRRLLGHATRWETEDWLASHKVVRNYSIDDLQADILTLNELLAEPK